jgi:hypothetical protein
MTLSPVQRAHREVISGKLHDFVVELRAEVA